MNKKSTFLIDNYIYIVALYFVIFFIIRVFIVGGSLERDEAEQMLLIDNLAFGYGTQPPLYSWIQQLFFDLFGNSIAALALLKNLLLFIGYLFIYKSAYILTKNRVIATVAMASMFMLPACSWECQRDLTHTVLAFSISSVLLYYILYLREKESLKPVNYIILGILVALSILSKYNLVIFIFAFLVVVFFDTKLKRVLLSKWILLSITIALLLTLPHSIWLVEHLSLAFRGTLNKLQSSSFSFLVLVKNFVLALVELFILYIIIYYFSFRGYIKKGSSVIKYHQIAVLVLTFIVAFALEATTIKSRWLVVLLSATLIYFATKIDTSKYVIKSVNRFLYISIFFMLLIILAYILRVYKPSLFHKNPRFNYPYQEIVTKVLNRDFNKTIYTSSLSGGNIKYIYPNLDVKILKDLDIKKGSLILLDRDNIYLKEKIEKELNIKFKPEVKNYRNSKDKFTIYIGEYR